jgi:hypothetical protein
MKRIVLINIVLIVCTVISCRSTKTIQTAIAKKDTTTIVAADSKADSLRFISEVYKGIENNIVDFNTFSAKVKVDFQGNDGKKNDFNAFLRMKKDSAIWVSINALLGIEAFRIIITPDSVKVLNKIDKVVQLRSVSYLQEVMRIPFTFYDVQNVIIGNPIYLDSTQVSYKKDGQTVALISVGSLFKHLLSVSNTDYRLHYSKLDDVDASRARTAFITYGDYEEKDGMRFSTLRKITVSEKSRVDIEMQFKQYQFNEVLNFPFNVPRNYKSN